MNLNPGHLQNPLFFSSCVLSSHQISFPYVRHYRQRKILSLSRWNLYSHQTGHYNCSNVVNLNSKSPSLIMIRITSDAASSSCILLIYREGLLYYLICPIFGRILWFQRQFINTVIKLKAKLTFSKKYIKGYVCFLRSSITLFCDPLLSRAPISDVSTTHIELKYYQNTKEGIGLW